MPVDFEFWRRTATAGITLSVLPETALDAVAQVDHLRAVLTWYADPENYLDGGLLWPHVKENPPGMAARLALAGLADPMLFAQLHASPTSPTVERGSTP